jgi:hypothetical protein
MLDTNFHTHTEQEEEMHTKFSPENLTRHYLEDQGTPERIILRLIQKKSGWGDRHWINLAQDRAQ